jgi:hypothetical protein
MDPDIWGPKAWFFLYSITLAYPENPTKNDKQNYYIFFSSLKNILPCAKCRLHFSENLEKYPLTDDILNSKKQLFKWLYEIQNEVREKNGKKRRTLTSTYEHMNKAYSKYSFPFKDIINMKILIPIILIIVGTLGLIIYNRKNNVKLVVN